MRRWQFHEQHVASPGPGSSAAVFTGGRSGFRDCRSRNRAQRRSPKPIDRSERPSPRRITWMHLHLDWPKLQYSHLPDELPMHRLSRRDHFRNRRRRRHSQQYRQWLRDRSTHNNPGAVFHIQPDRQWRPQYHCRRPDKLHQQRNSRVPCNLHRNRRHLLRPKSLRKLSGERHIYDKFFARLHSQRHSLRPTGKWKLLALESSGRARLQS